MKYNSVEDFGIELLSKIDSKGVGYVSRSGIQNSLKEYNFI